MLKKISLILAMVLFSSMVLAGCGDTGLEEEKQQVYGQWEYCLKVHNTKLELATWALDQAQVYAEDPCWDTLLKARAVASTAKLLLSQMELVGYEVKEADYLLLLKAGLEPEVILTEYEQLEENLEQEVVLLTCLEELLMTDVCFSPTTQELGGWIANSRERMRLESEYLSLTTNYLLLQWEYKEQWQMFRNTFPGIAADSVWDDNPDQLMTKCTATLNNMQELETAEAQFFGISLYTSRLVKGAVEAGGYEKLVPYLQIMPDAPVLFPCPAWLPDELQMVYQIADPETGENRLLQPGEKMTAAPSLFYLTCEDVALADFKEFAAILESFGLNVQTDFEELSSAQILCKSGDYTLSLQWKKGTVVMYMPLPVGCLVPEWYISSQISE